MKKVLTASAIALLMGFGASAAAQAMPAQTLAFQGQSMEAQQVGFKKRFKHRRHFRSGRFGHHRFGHRRFHRGQVFHRGFRDRHHRRDVYLDGKVLKKGHGHKGHHGHGVVLKKKVITPFGIFFKK